MKNFLDLREKVAPQVKIIYKTVAQRQSWYVELAKVLAVIVVVSTIVWGVSKANDLPSTPKIKNFSVTGIVSNIDATSLTLINAKGSDAQKNTYTLDLSKVLKIENTKYVPLTVSQINLKDKVVAQGIITDGNIEIKRIISFGQPIIINIENTDTQKVDTSSTSTATSTASSTDTSITTSVTSTSTATSTIDSVTVPTDSTTASSSTTTKTDVVVTPTPSPASGSDSTQATDTPVIQNDAPPTEVTN